jgi:hypothetical protein
MSNILRESASQDSLEILLTEARSLCQRVSSYLCL